MLATILKSPQATETTLAIIETFSKIRELTRIVGELAKTTTKEEKEPLMNERKMFYFKIGVEFGNTLIEISFDSDSSSEAKKKKQELYDMFEKIFGDGHVNDIIEFLDVLLDSDVAERVYTHKTIGELHATIELIKTVQSRAEGATSNKHRGIILILLDKNDIVVISFDYAIKYLLRDKADFVILSGFLSELIGRKVEVQAILESESNKVDKDEKTNRTDLKAQIDDGEIAVFEIQFYDEADFFSRVLYGVARAIIEQVPVGAKLYDVKKVYSVNIAYYDLGATREYLFNGKFDGFRGVNFTDEIIPFAQTLDIEACKGPKAYIHPEYYLILPNMFDEKMRNRFDEWVYVLKKSAVRSDFVAAGMEEVKLKLDLLNMQSSERKVYEKYLRNISSYYSALHTATVKGRVEGEAKGREEGWAEGQAKGQEEGEKRKAREIAENLKNIGIPTPQIVKTTGLTAKEIENM